MLTVEYKGPHSNMEITCYYTILKHKHNHFSRDTKTSFSSNSNRKRKAFRSVNTSCNTPVNKRWESPFNIMKSLQERLLLEETPRPHMTVWYVGSGPGWDGSLHKQMFVLPLTHTVHTHKNWHRQLCVCVCQCVWSPAVHQFFSLEGGA